jgi:hypothetical protein
MFIYGAAFGRVQKMLSPSSSFSSSSSKILKNRERGRTAQGIFYADSKTALQQKNIPLPPPLNA